MSIRRAIIVALLGAFVTSPAFAGTSQFRVVEAKPKGKGKLEVRVAYSQVGTPCDITFYAHGSPPHHRLEKDALPGTPAMASGLMLQRFPNVPLGDGIQTLEVSRRAVRDKLKLKAGDELYIAAKWTQGIGGGHEWGVASANPADCHYNGTHFKIPGKAQQNSTLRRPMAIKARVATGWRPRRKGLSRWRIPGVRGRR